MKNEFFNVFMIIKKVFDIIYWSHITDTSPATYALTNNEKGETPLLLAVRNGHTECAKRVMKELNRERDTERKIFQQFDHYGLNPLTWAHILGNGDMLDILLGNKQDERDNLMHRLFRQHFWSALSYQFRRIISSELFEQKNSSGQIPLHLAVKSGSHKHMLACQLAMKLEGGLIPDAFLKLPDDNDDTPLSLHGNIPDFSFL